MFYTAFILGLLSSAHCLGMCGPIALALPLGQKSASRRALGVGAYNVGRIVTYTSLGLLLGLIGVGVKISGYQNVLSITIGLLILIGLLFPFIARRLSPTSKISRFLSPLKTAISRKLSKTSLSSLFSLGVLNGFLPCGMVYIALAGALTSQSLTNAALFMTFFGLGTLPAMFALPMLGKFLSDKNRAKISKWTPYLLALVGLLFILRGLELGIPFLSPVLESGVAANPNCH